MKEGEEREGRQGREEREEIGGSEERKGSGRVRRVRKERRQK